MALLFPWIATLSAALFAGGALFVSVVEHPARMKAGVAVALAEFRPSYRRAAPWQASTAALSFLAGALGSFLTWQWLWAVGGLLVGATIPFTLVVILPVNRRLLDSSALLTEAEAASLFERWARLHWVRSALGTGGLIVLLCKAFFL